MKALDIHIHVFPEGIVQKPLKKVSPYLYSLMNQSILTVDYYLKIMDENDIEKAVILPLQFDETFYVPNDFVSATVQKYPDRFIKFSTVNPLHEHAYAILEEEYTTGTNGVKLYPPLGFYPYQKEFDRLYDFIADHSLPVLFHCGVPLYHSHLRAKFSRPIHFDELALNYPTLKIIIAHFGWPWYGEAIAMAWRHDNIYLDTSALYDLHPLTEALERVGADKIVYGSDFMGEVEESEVTNTFKALKYIRSNLPEDSKRKILFDNAHKLLPK